MLVSIYKEGHHKNSLFGEVDKTHKYNPLSADKYLRACFEEYGVEVNTPDLNIGRDIDFEIYIEARVPVKSPLRKFLIAMENPIHNRMSRDHEILDQYDLVFSWDKDFLGGRKNYLFSYIPNEVMLIEPERFFEKRERMICLINANKSFKEKISGDLYEERYSLIKWFERNALNDFDLYGVGWNKPYAGVGFFQKQKRNFLSVKSKFTDKPIFPSFCGEAPSKSVYLDYQFAICYENISTFPYYITEKILDAMAYGCIPVYWGAPNISEVIPRECFIDRREFASNEELYGYLISLDDQQTKKYRSAIMEFMEGRGAETFSYEATIKPIVEQIVKLF